MKFAFSDEQFNKGMKELGLDPKDTDKFGFKTNLYSLKLYPS